MTKKNNNKLRLDIACGKNKKPGFLGVDIWDGADIVADLEKFPWPFNDNSVDEIFCSHYIEHTPDLISFANELHRIMKQGSKLEIVAPYYSSIRAWQDPTHLRAISENTFLYFNKKWREINRLDHYPITADFDFEYRLILASDWQNKPEDEVTFAIRHYINVVADIQVLLTKRTSGIEIYEHQIEQATSLWNKRQRLKASSICRELIDSGIENLDILLMLAEYELSKNNLIVAEGYFKKALALDTSSLQAHSGLLRTYTVAGKDKEYSEHLDNIISEYPEITDCLTSLGIIKASS